MDSFKLFTLNSSDLSQTKRQKYLHDGRWHFVQYMHDVIYMALRFDVVEICEM